MYLYPRSKIVKNRYLQSMYKEVDVNNKSMQGFRSGLLPENGISCLIPTLFLSLLFPYSSAAPLPQDSSLLGWSLLLAPEQGPESASSF